MSIQQRMRDFVKEVLFELDERKFDEVMQYFDDQGIVEARHLLFADDEELKTILKPVQCCRLQEALRKRMEDYSDYTKRVAMNDFDVRLDNMEKERYEMKLEQEIMIKGLEVAGQNKRTALECNRDIKVEEAKRDTKLAEVELKELQLGAINMGIELQRMVNQRAQLAIQDRGLCRVS